MRDVLEVVTRSQPKDISIDRLIVGTELEKVENLIADEGQIGECLDL